MALRVVLLLLFSLSVCVKAQMNPQGCGVNQPMYAGDWARKGVRVSLIKTGDSTTCSRYVTLEMVDEERFHSNPYADQLAIIVNFPPGPALVVPYEMGKRVYNVTLQLPQLPCDASPSCVDYIGSICQQQGVGFYYQLRMKADSGCAGGNEFMGIRDGETFNTATWNFEEGPNAACMPGNSASYENIDEAIQDLVASLGPHPTLPNSCAWTVTLALAPNQRFRDSDYIDMVSFRGTGATNYGAGTRMFFKGRPSYTATLPGPANCGDTVLDVEVVLLNEFLGAYPAYITGKSTCPFFSYKRYQFNNNQHYSFATGAGSTGAGGAASAPQVYPFPTDAACTTPQPPQQLPCPAMLSTGEVRRGFGAYFQTNCQVAGGSWAVYNFPGGQSCCRTCRWNKQDAVAAWLQPTELDDCPPCVKAYYEATNSGPVEVVPLAPLVSDVQCPFPKPPGGDMSLPSWIYSPETGKCYYKSSFAKGISNNINDAIRRCTQVHGGQLLKISSQAEDDFVRFNLLWTGFFGETYTGLKKLGRLDPDFDNNWRWADNTVLGPNDYQRWSAAPRNRDYVEDEAVCMEYLPQQPKTWNPFACTVNKHYICERPATNPVPVVPAAAGSAPVDCSTMPSMPQGAVAPVALINAGGPAMCNYYAADLAAAPVATGGAVDNWVGRDAACQSQRTACSIRFGGAFSYTINTVAGRSYVVRFTFAEVWWAAAGQRQFNVLVDGFTVLSAVDPFALAGGAKFVPVVRQLTKIAAGSTMVINLQARVDNAALAALEVFDMGPAPIVPSSPSPAPAVASSPSPSPTQAAQVVTPSPSPAAPAVTTPSPNPSSADNTGTGALGSSDPQQSPQLSTAGTSPAPPTTVNTSNSDAASGNTTEGPNGSSVEDSNAAGVDVPAPGPTASAGDTPAGPTGGDAPMMSSPSPSLDADLPSLLQGSTAGVQQAAPTSKPTGGNAAATASVKPALALLLALLVLLM